MFLFQLNLSSEADSEGEASTSCKTNLEISAFVKIFEIDCATCPPLLIVQDLPLCLSEN
jgi:hypothetical protein